MIQTILGANGAIGTEIAKALPPYGAKVRLVSRNPKKVNEQDELVVADLLNREQTLKAVEGSSIVYLTAGLPYQTKLWQKQWPVLMQNTIEACKVYKAKLVFFDNVYSYGRVNGVMTEQSPLAPCSKKGEVRKILVQMLESEMAKGEIDVLIARSADFIGYTPMSFLDSMVFKNLKAGKKAQWFINPDFKHSFTFIPDAGKATAFLGNTPEAYNQSWHLPTDAPITGNEFVAIAARAFKAKPGIMPLPIWMMHIIGLFIPVLKESIEMMYQYDADYEFSSAKIEQTFGLRPTPIHEAITATANQYQ
ncbi:MAG: NAD-dependent epimerase/dehydratase family protein [Bacteroidia bacterium]|jgi:nucleoside-diphosphate-sugar epimerase|nr:NAD-dependent epimerase/dehydratase family protein [Bacteroidia bacterium]